MPAAPQSPHDEFFKAVFSDIQHARDLLEGVLPPEVRRQLDLDELVPEPASFVSEALRESLTDLLFSCPIKGSRAIVALLLEHKTWQPRHPHLQILRYMVSIWEKNIADAKPLQVVVPIVVHQGTTAWKMSPFADSFDGIPEELLAFIPRFDLVLEDLVQTQDKALREGFGNAYVQTALAIMKHIFSPEGTLAVARTLHPDLGNLEGENALRSLHILLEYILKGGDTALRDSLILSIHPNLKGQTMTIADTLRQEGRAEAESEFVTIADTLRSEGKAEGLEQGIRASKLEDARRMREHGIGWEIVTDVTGLKPEDLQ
jgi:predicted transposase YdaD